MISFDRPKTAKGFVDNISMHEETNAGSASLYKNMIKHKGYLTEHWRARWTPLCDVHTRTLLPAPLRSDRWAACQCARSGLIFGSVTNACSLSTGCGAADA